MSARAVKYFFIVCTVALISVLYLLNRKYNTHSDFTQVEDDIETRMSNDSGRILLLYWSKFFDYPEPPVLYSQEQCPVPCELTSNKSRVREASALLVHSRNIDEMPPERYRNIPWVFYSHENPNNAPAWRNSRIVSKFTYYMTYRLDSDFPDSGFIKPSLDKPVPFSKKKLLVAIYTNCEPVRTEYMRRLMKIIPFDSYGYCLRNKFGYADRYAHNCTNVALEIQRGYKFTLTFTNGDCDYYFTEKLGNALSSGSVPVWLGTDKIDEVLWGNLRHSVIKVSDYPSPAKLVEYLMFLSRNEAEYNKYLKWKYEGFNFPPEYYHSKIGQCWDGLPNYCRLCIGIARDNKRTLRGLEPDKCDQSQRRTLEKWIRE